MSESRALRVLVVCAANQCRSRAAEAVLKQELQGITSIQVASAGVLVEQAQPMCSKASAFLTEAGITHDAQRPSRSITADVIDVADLILVADRSVSAAVVEMNPNARGRLFSLRTAGSAAAHLVQEQRVQQAREAHAQGQAHATELIDGEEEVLTSALAPGMNAAAKWLAEELAAAHGYMQSPGSADILDAHGTWLPVHPKTLQQVRDAVTPMAALLRAIAQPSPP